MPVQTCSFSQRAAFSGYSALVSALISQATDPRRSARRADLHVQQKLLSAVWHLARNATKKRLNATTGWLFVPGTPQTSCWEASNYMHPLHQAVGEVCNQPEKQASRPATELVGFVLRRTRKLDLQERFYRYNHQSIYRKSQAADCTRVRQGVSRHRYQG